MESDFEKFTFFGRVRSMAKEVDPYSLTYEKNGKVFVALSYRVTVNAENFRNLKDSTCKTWMKLLLDIARERRGRGEHGRI